MADITFTCPRCQQGLVIDEEGAGMMVECPTCAQLLSVPEAHHESKETQRMRLFEYPDASSPVKPSEVGKKK
jgi:transcription elongation factor Elf1